MVDEIKDVEYEVFELPHVKNQIKEEPHGKCEKCFFWQSLKNGFPSPNNNVRGKQGNNLGECRFNAPSLGDPNTPWPATFDFDWCGHFRARSGTGGLAGKLR